MTLFPTTVERASCKVRKSLCTGEFPTALISNVLVVAVVPVFLPVGELGTSAESVHDPLPSSSFPLSCSYTLYTVTGFPGR